MAVASSFNVVLALWVCAGTTQLVHSQFYLVGDKLCKFYSTGVKYCQEECSPLPGDKNYRASMPDEAFPKNVPDKFGADHNVGNLAWIRCTDAPKKSVWSAAQGFDFATAVGPEKYVGSCSFHKDAEQTFNCDKCVRDFQTSPIPTSCNHDDPNPSLAGQKWTQSGKRDNISIN